MAKIHLLDDRNIEDNLESEDSGQVLSAKQGKVLKETADSLESRVGSVENNLTVENTSFIFDTHNGEFGWNESPERGADTFHPFKQKHTETYTPTERKNNNDMGESHKYRYVNTNSVPNINDETYTPTSRSASLDMGATNKKRYVNTNSVPNSNSGTYNATTRSSSIDMGATNTYRYVNTSGVPGGSFSLKSGTVNTNDVGYHGSSTYTGGATVQLFTPTVTFSNGVITITQRELIKGYSWNENPNKTLDRNIVTTIKVE